MIFWWFSWFSRAFWEVSGYPFEGSWADGPGSVYPSPKVASILVAFWRFLSKTFQNIIIFIGFSSFLERFWEVLSPSGANPLDMGSIFSGFRQSRFQGVSKIPLFELWDPDLMVQILRSRSRILGFHQNTSFLESFLRGFERFWAVRDPLAEWVPQVQGISAWSGGLLSPFGASWPGPLKNLPKYHHFHSSDHQNPSKTYQKSRFHQGGWGTGHRNIMVFACFWPLFGPPFWELFPGAFRCPE